MWIWFIPLTHELTLHLQWIIKHSLHSWHFRVNLKNYIPTNLYKIDNPQKLAPNGFKWFQSTTKIYHSIFWCNFLISSQKYLEIRAPTTSRREETRKRRQALQKIFCFLDVDSLLVVAQVCREWKKVSRNRSLWKRVVLENKKCSSKVMTFKRLKVKKKYSNISQFIWRELLNDLRYMCIKSLKHFYYLSVPDQFVQLVH